MPRDTPPVALPALVFEDADTGPLRYGGAPRMPDALAWPVSRDGTPMQFVAEIDFGQLPHSLEQAGHVYEMPAFPEKGRLFIFIPLRGDSAFAEDPAVLYSADATDETPTRKLPDALPPLHPENDYGFHPDALSDDARSLKPGAMSVRPYLSARAENPLWRNMDREELSEDDMYARDRAYADHLKALGIDYEVPLPRPTAAREPLYDEIPICYQGYFQKGVFQWDWRYLFEVAKIAYAHCHDLPIEQLEAWIEDGDDKPRYHRLIRMFRRRKANILAQRIDDRPGWFERFVSDHAPGVDRKADLLFRSWMRYARVHQKKRALTEADKRAFVNLLQHIDQLGKTRGTVDLFVLSQFRQHRVQNFYVDDVLLGAFKQTAETLQDLHPDRSREPKFDFGDADRAARALQMFGAGYLLQHAAIEHEDKVLLFQISDACGLQIEDGILQAWITHEDLAAGRFDRVITTLECT